MNGHAITAWLFVLLRRIGSEAGKARQACANEAKRAICLLYWTRTMDCCSLMETGRRYVFGEWLFMCVEKVGIILLDAYGIAGGCNQKTVQVVSFTCPVRADSNKKNCPLSRPVSNVTVPRAPSPALAAEARRGFVVATGMTIAPDSVFRKENVKESVFLALTPGFRTHEARASADGVIVCLAERGAKRIRSQG